MLILSLMLSSPLLLAPSTSSLIHPLTPHPFPTICLPPSLCLCTAQDPASSTIPIVSTGSPERGAVGLDAIPSLGFLPTLAHTASVTHSSLPPSWWRA